jgi:lysozyme
MNKYIILLISLLSFQISKASDSDDGSYIQCEDTCNHVHGIDLSHYQGGVFWETVGNNSKMAYVYLKATEGGSKIDEKYRENIDMAHRYGIKVGSYHFFRPKVDLQMQLGNFTSQCLPGDQDLIPMIDVESKSNLNNEEFLDSLDKFLDMVTKAYHQRPLIYTFANFYDHVLMGFIDDYKVMIAQYTKREPILCDGKDILMWQYTGKGHINGINTFVDKSRFIGNHGLKEIRFRH